MSKQCPQCRVQRIARTAMIMTASLVVMTSSSPAQEQGHPTDRFRKFRNVMPISVGRPSLPTHTTMVVHQAIEPIGKTIAGWMDRNQEKINFARTLIEADSKETGDQRDSALALLKISILEHYPDGFPSHNKELDTARVSSLRALEALKGVAAIAAEPEWQNYTACANFLVGRAMVLSWMFGNSDSPEQVSEGVAYFQTALDLWADLAKKHPENKNYLRLVDNQATLTIAWLYRDDPQLALAIIRKHEPTILKSRLSRKGNQQQQLIYHQTAMARLAWIADQKDVAFKQMSSAVNSAFEYWQTDRTDEVRAHAVAKLLAELSCMKPVAHEQITAKCQQLERALPNTSNVLRSTMDTLTNVAVSLEDKGDIAGAIDLYLQVVALKKREVDRMFRQTNDEVAQFFTYDYRIPERPLSSAVLMRDLAAIGKLQLLHGNHEAALDRFDTAIGIWEGLEKRDSLVKRSMNWNYRKIAAYPVEKRAKRATSAKQAMISWSQRVPPGGFAMQSVGGHIYAGKAQLLLTQSGPKNIATAIECAERASALTFYNDPDVIRTLADVYRAGGRNDWKACLKLADQVADNIGNKVLGELGLNE